MADLFGSLHDPRQLSGTSGAEVSDLRPEQAYDTDLRRLDSRDRSAASSLNSKQEQIAKYFRAARSAGKYQQKASIDEPSIRGRTPRSSASIGGSVVPSLGDSGGRSGSTSYAKKPKAQFGRGF